MTLKYLTRTEGKKLQHMIWSSPMNTMKPFHPHLISHLENRFNQLAWSIARVCYRLYIYLSDFRNWEAKFSRSAQEELFSLNFQL